MDEKITSRDNPKVKYACKLADSPGFRRSEGRFFAEGRKLCPELARGAALEQLFYTAAAAQKCPERAGWPGQHFLVEEHVAEKLAEGASHQGVFGVFAILCLVPFFMGLSMIIRSDLKSRSKIWWKRGLSQVVNGMANGLLLALISVSFSSCMMRPYYYLF